jgi:hypothetical protein
MTVPNTGGWSSYRDVNVSVSLAAGTQVMRVRMAGNGSTGAVGNFDYIRLASGSTSNTPPTVSVTAPANGATFSAPRTVGLSRDSVGPGRHDRPRRVLRRLHAHRHRHDQPVHGLLERPDRGQLHADGPRHRQRGRGHHVGAVTVTANPSRAAFTPPSDHSTAVTSYLLEIYTAGSTPGTSTPARSHNIGKPSVINGEIAVDITAVLQPLAPGSYFATMSAVRSTGSTRSAASNTFAR